MTTAEDRVLRAIAVLFGVGGAVFGGLTLPQLAGQLDRAPLAWTVAAAAGTIGAPILLGLIAVRAPIRIVRAGGAVVAAANLAAMLTVAPVWHGGATAAVSPWVLQLTALGTTAAAFALPLPLAVTDVVLTGVLVTADRLLTGDPGLLLIAVQDGAFALLFSAVFAALAVGSLRAAGRADRAHAAAEAATEAAVADRIRADERARVDGLVHDHVLTALLVAARSPAPSPTAAADAREALRRLRPADTAAPATVPTEALLDRIRAVVTRTAPDAAVVVEGAGRPILPAGVAEALLGALGEALRNAVGHGGEGTAVEVHVIAADGVEVAIVDDGPGFDPRAVRPDRLGIATSIVARMAKAGGAAEVRSLPGRGTAVRLVWPR